MSDADVIDRLVGIAPGSALDAIRAARPAARENAQRSYAALFEPEVPGDVTAVERFALAAFVAGLHPEPKVAAFYAAGLSEEPAIAEAVAAEAAAGAATGPYGSFPIGPLSAEDLPGPRHLVAAAHRRVLGARLSAAIEHAHLLIHHPRDASADALQKLLESGWSATDIVTLSQLVAFLSFQIRVIAGLRAMATVQGAPI